MKKYGLQWLTAAVFAGLIFTATASADTYYEVTVTNITKGMTFTPIMVATTRGDESIFQLGEAASLELEAVAEMGDLSGLVSSLDAYDVTDSSFLPFLAPGESVTQVVAAKGRYRYISLASMLIPSNDTFIALNSVAAPNGKRSASYALRAYDAGTELNDELCASLPGPGCGGDPGPMSDNGEGYVYVSNGIRGVGDLDSDLLDWNNPVAIVTITRASQNGDDDD